MLNFPCCVCVAWGNTVFCLLFIIAVPRVSQECVFVRVCDKEYRRMVQTGRLLTSFLKEWLV
jgi:hypothetical protein